MESENVQDGIEDYKKHANSKKDEGNEAFQRGDISEAIQLYTQAIDLDPDNHVFYSNRSAAHMKADSKSKALKDAEKCIELAPTWAKGYSRLAVAQQGLKRYEAAVETYKKILEMEPSNQSMWTALRECQEAFSIDKKGRFEAAAKERAAEEERLRRLDEAKAAAQKEKEIKDQEQKMSDFFSQLDSSNQNDQEADLAAATSSGGDDDLLAGFFTEISEKPAAKEEPKATGTKLSNDKYTNQDLGDAMTQLQRLTQPNYQWRNLNPYYVMELGIDATDEDIKQRYRKLSSKVHPDKMHGIENAREAFEEVKSAYHKLTDEKQRSVIIDNIEHVKNELDKERRRLISKGLKESSLKPYAEELDKRLMKHFAEIEMNRRRSETNLRFYNARERIQEDTEKEQMRKDEEKEKAWADIERREKRVGQWRDFQEDPDAKKVRSSSYKEETRDDPKHGKVKLEEWKKKWK